MSNCICLPVRSDVTRNAPSLCPPVYKHVPSGLNANSEVARVEGKGDRYRGKDVAMLLAPLPLPVPVPGVPKPRPDVLGKEDSPSRFPSPSLVSKRSVAITGDIDDPPPDEDTIDDTKAVPAGVCTYFNNGANKARYVEAKSSVPAE